MPTTVLQYDNSGFQRGMGLYEAMLKEIAATQRQAMASRASVTNQGLQGKADIIAARQGSYLPAYSTDVGVGESPYQTGQSGYTDPYGVFNYGMNPWAMPYVDPRWGRSGVERPTPQPQAVNTQPTGVLVTQQQTAPVPTEEMKRMYPSIFK